MNGTKRPGHTLPEVDDAENIDIADVVGNKNDTHSGTSLCSTAKRLDEHFHSIPFNYPTLADGVTVTGHADGWALGAFVEIIPENTITEDFDIHHVSISAISGNDSYELYLYNDETLIGHVPEFTRDTGVGSVVAFDTQTELQAANSKIQAKLASKGGAAKSVKVKLNGHKY